jgi:hypothetical protein
MQIQPKRFCEYSLQLAPCRCQRLSWREYGYVDGVTRVVAIGGFEGLFGFAVAWNYQRQPL